MRWAVDGHQRRRGDPPGPRARTGQDDRHHPLRLRHALPVEAVQPRVPALERVCPSPVGSIGRTCRAGLRRSRNGLNRSRIATHFRFCHRRRRYKQSHLHPTGRHVHDITHRFHGARFRRRHDARAESTSMTGWATAGACCSRTPRTSRRSARPSSAISPSSSPSSTGAMPSSSASRSIRSTTIAAGSRTSSAWRREVDYPIIADHDLEVSKLYDMLPSEEPGSAEGRTAATNQTVRTVYMIGPDKLIKAMLIYPMSTGRNFDEVLRLLDSLQLTAEHKVATPVNWKYGEDCIIVPSVSGRRRSNAVPGRLDQRPSLFALGAPPRSRAGAGASPGPDRIGDPLASFPGAATLAPGKRPDQNPDDTMLARVAGFSGGTTFVASGPATTKSSTTFQSPSSCFL